MRPARSLPWLVAVVATMVAGCAQQDGTAGERLAGTTGSARAVIDCGGYRVGPGPKVDPAGKLACLNSAAQGRRAARLVVDRITTEGDPIRHAYTTRADGRIEVHRDATADRFAAPQDRIVERQTCRPPLREAFPSLTGCTPWAPVSSPAHGD